MTLIMVGIIIGLLLFMSNGVFASGRVSATDEIELTSEIEKISLKGFNGSIEWNPVLAEEKPRIIIKKQVYGFLHDNMMSYLNELEVKDLSTNKELILETTKPWISFGVISSTVRFILYATPEQITSFKGEMSNGSITINSSFNCPLNLITSNGSINLKSGSGQVRLRTSNGKIDFGRVNLIDSSQITTSNGLIVGWASLGSSGEYLFETSNGRVDLAFPRETQGTFHVSTNNGRVNFNLGDRILNTKRAIVDLGEGPNVQIRTSNGSISVQGT